MYNVLFPILAVVVAFLYLKRATIGLENHLKKISFSFFILATFELLSTTSLLQDSTNVVLYNLTKSYGYVWITEHLLLVLFIWLVFSWSFVYLFKSFSTQLFIIFNFTILVIFLITTLSFTTLLTRNVQNETLERLKTDVRVLSYAIDAKKAETLSDAQLVSTDERIVSAMVESNTTGINQILKDYLVNKSKNSLVLIDADGKVITRGENSEAKGDSISGDGVVKRVLLGEKVVSVGVFDGYLNKSILVSAGSPIKSGDTILGAVVAGVLVDSSFAAGIKTATGLESAIFAGENISATTLMSGNKIDSLVGVKNSNNESTKVVLQEGKNYTGSSNFGGQDYFAAYLPLVDIDNQPIGMLSVLSPQIGVLQTASRSVEATFVVISLLMLLSIIPALYVSRYLSEQL